MELLDIEAALKDSNLQIRLQAIAALKEHDAEVAVPLLKSKMGDVEFILRSFVARGLGQHLTEDSFGALLEMVQKERDINVKAEAANSLSLFGDESLPHLVQAFLNSDNWLVRHSILACLLDMGAAEEVYVVSTEAAFNDKDSNIRELAIDSLAALSDSPQQSNALTQLLKLKDEDNILVRQRVAYALKRFDTPEAKAALAQLRQDPDYRVVGAAMEDLL
ncbi:MAG: HEAT repeat domain-containing protein [Oculatellaceae cyanobacterium Prado106]|jgi:HEAT repeat protein|nr:HEAT repeat domain-containing protein [Oculatellaceae cyanobacterium Prado106]